MDWGLFFEELLIVVITTITPFVAYAITRYFHSAADDIVNESTRFYVEKAIDIIHDIVIEINQTYVDSLKSKGEFTQEAQQVAKQTAIAKANQMICQEMKDAIADIYGSFNAFLQTKIESTVHEEKKG